MKIIRCGQGHPYSENLPECPTCANEFSMIQYDDPPSGDEQFDEEGEAGGEDGGEGGADSIVERDGMDDNGDTVPPIDHPGQPAPSIDPKRGWFSRAGSTDNATGVEKSVGPGAVNRQQPGSRPSGGPVRQSPGGGKAPRKSSVPKDAGNAPPRRARRDPQIGEKDPVDHIDRVRVHAADRRQLLVTGLLVMLDGAEPGRFFALFEGVNSIGKASNPENNIQIPVDKFVSRNHAELEYKGEDGAVFLLRDLGSSNGTYLNDDPRRVCPEEDVALLPGDVVRIGRTRLRFMPMYP